MITGESGTGKEVFEKQVHPIGSSTVLPVDIRIISATNQDLNKIVHQKTFPLDLLYRLNVLNLHLMPLRKRREDIVLFADEFISKKSACFYHKNLKIIHEMMDSLSEYPFPGNYRELENILERACIFLKIALPSCDFRFRVIPFLFLLTLA